jgi:hypothetical protein
MLKWIIRRKLAAFERTYGYDATYMRDLLDTDLGAFMAFARACKLGQYRKDVPREVWMAASMVSIVHEDCGPCTQLGVTLALAEGIDAKVIAAVLAGDRARMSPEVALGVDFARATIAHAPEVDELREQIVARWGKRAVVALAFAVLSSRLYPTVKYALGYGKACQRITVEGQVVSIVRPIDRTVVAEPAA